MLERSLEGKYRSAAQGEAFLGTFEVDDPSTVRVGDGCTPIVQKKYEVNFIARYYPFSHYQETRPSVLDLPGQGDEDNSDDEGRERGHVEPLVDVRWVGRKLPKVRR